MLVELVSGMDGWTVIVDGETLPGVYPNDGDAWDAFRETVQYQRERHGIVR